MNRERYWHVASLAIIAAIVALTACGAPPEAPVSEIEAAVLAEDWEKALELAESPEQPEAVPVLRAIKGHALLALNQNNDSFVSFSSVAEPDDLETWKRWGIAVASRHPRSAVALYLLGDAYARVGDWESAVRAFDEALANEPSFHLAFNARGV